MKHILQISQSFKLTAMKRLLMLLCISLLSLQAKATTFTVTSTSNAGAGSMRQAILDANANSGADIIDFNIGGGGAQDITLTADLPTITEALTIDGTTQPSYFGTPLISIGSTWTGTILNSSATGAIVITAIDVSKTGTATGVGIILNNSSNLSITNCLLKNRQYSVQLSSSANIVFTGNDLTNSGVSGGYAIYLSNNTGTFTATGNTFGGTTNAAIRMISMSNITISPTSGNIQVGTQLKEINTPLSISGGSNITVTDLDLGKSIAGGTGIDVNTVTNLSITNCILGNRNYGLLLTSNVNSTITGNDFTNSGIGGGFSLYLVSNSGTFTATGNTYGGSTTQAIRMAGMSNITIASSSGNIQVGTQLKEIATPIIIAGGSNITITDLDLGKSVTGGSGLDANSVTNLSVTNCIVTNRIYGMLLSSNSNITITGNDFTNSGVSGGYVLYLASNSGTFTATGNTYGGSTTQAIRMSGMSNITIAPSFGNIQVGNQLKEIITPLIIAGGSNITVSDLDLGKTSTGGSALDISGISTMSITNCIITNRTYGIILGNSSNVTITGNDLTNSGVSGAYAMHLSSLTGTLVATGNTFGGVTTSGIYMSSLSGKTIGATSGDIQVGNQLKEMTTPLIITGGSNITVSGLDFGKTSAGGNGIDINGVSTLSVLNCIFSNRNYGLLFQSCSNVLATGNSLSNIANYIIYLNNISGALDISNNTFGPSSNSGLYMTAMSKRIISDGSVVGTNVVIPDGSVFKTLNGNSVEIVGGSNN
ncbi:MAG TPA: right-handed parallel beta-helix repeat-containing protein, partial [Chitinophagaceae bacterium]|nr:right-handed parallel beta-helix repeat-containing protein [Chitinophagaceae bacterium]